MHTFTFIYLHVVFATWSRQRFLSADLRPSAHAYLASTARNLGVSDVHAGGHDDHVHLLGRFDPASAPSAVIGRVKQAGTNWFRERGDRRFRWQRGFSAFSVSRDRIPAVVRYIQRQEEHHRRVDFRAEYQALLREFGVSLDEAHLL